HIASAQHRIAAYLEDAAVGPRALVAHLQPSVVDGATELSFKIRRDEFAPISEIAEILRTARPPGEEGLGQLNHLLEIAVARGKSPRGVEHDNTVAHIVEGHAQFGLALAQFLEQARILDRDHRLVGEGGGEFDLFFGEWFDACALNAEYADQL